MFTIKIDAIVVLCTVMLVWWLIRVHLRMTQTNSQGDPISMDDYLRKITLVTGFSVYDTFCKSAEDWRVSADRIDRDFKIYLSSQSVPYYVKDFVRKGQKHIDELYTGKGNNLQRGRLILFFTFLTLVLWGGAVIVSLYVIPYFLPDEYRMFFYGPP